jgi:hypothetical protein
MKKLFTLLFLLLYLILNIEAQRNQPTCYDNTPVFNLSLGLNKFGLGLGSFGTYNGINLSLFDNTCHLNGIGISFIGNVNPKKNCNGIDFGVIPMSDNVNGISLGVLAGSVEGKLNGISCYGLFSETWNVNGVCVSGLIQMNNSINGFTSGGLCLISDVQNGFGLSFLIQRIDNVANGLTITGLYYNAEKTNGLAVAPVNLVDTTNGVQVGAYNKSDKLNGVQIGVFNHVGMGSGFQFGLVNVIEENPRLLRCIPIMNFNFSKNPELFVDSVSYSNEGDTLVKEKTYYMNRGLKSITNKKNNKSNGIDLSFYKNGHIRSETFNKNGVREYSKTYYKNGKIYIEEIYQNGEIQSIKTYHKNGQLMSERIYEKGKPVYPYWIYDKKGKIKSKVNELKLLDWETM